LRRILTSFLYQTLRIFDALNFQTLESLRTSQF
jgi:hypothetical protein